MTPMNCYLIGEHLGHSFSPELHRSFGRYEYGLKELAPAELGPFLESRAFSGLNVTVPYKQAVIPYLDRLDGRAAAIGAVNTVVNRNGELWGYNTDFDGMLASLRRLSGQSGCAPFQKCLILGTGGTSRTALTVCRALGAERIFRVSRTGREGALTYEAAAAAHRDADLVINTTPAGMYPDNEGLPLDLSAFPNLAAVFDCVYNPLRTRLVLAAQARGILAAAGLEMLVRQAACACERFTEAPVPEETVERLMKNLRASHQNLVLIGMPGAGKTTVGRILAQKANLQFVDLDEEIEKRAGKPISALFAEQGETFFRDLESDLVKELAAVGGRVIATGGGTVLRPENVRRLRQNGLLVLLDRPLAALEPSPDRPLGDTAEKLRRLYAERRPIYLAAADRTVPASDTPEAAADRILKGEDIG